MFDAGVSRLMHRHGDEWFEMTPQQEDATTPDASDIERKMLRGERVMRCPACDTEIRVAGPDSEG